MTAQLLEYTSGSDALVRRVRAARAAALQVTVAPHRDVRRPRASWTAGSARACEVSRPATIAAPVASSPTRLVWTDRGIAVLVSLVALVVGLMAATMVSAFLAVSNAPLAAVAGA